MQTVPANSPAEPWWISGFLAVLQGGPTAVILGFVLWQLLKLVSVGIDKWSAAQEADRLAMRDMTDRHATAMHSFAERVAASLEGLAHKHVEHKEEIRGHVTDESERTRDVVRERTVKR